jgi:hypothetical protein
MDAIKLLVVGMLFAIVANLGKGLYHMNRPGESAAVVRSLTWRVALSVSLFALLIVSWHFGWLAPMHGPR